MTVFPVPAGNSINLGAFIRNNSSEWKAADQNFRRLLELAPDANGGSESAGQYSLGKLTNRKYIWL